MILIEELNFNFIAVDFSAVSHISKVLGKKKEVHIKKKELHTKKDGFPLVKKVFEKRRLNI